MNSAPALEVSWRSVASHSTVGAPSTHHRLDDDAAQPVARRSNHPAGLFGVIEGKLVVERADLGRNAFAPAAPVEPTVISATEHEIPPCRRAGDADGGGNGLGAG